MRQVMTVSLNNNAYQIDEEAYRALRSYLDRSRSGLHGNPDADEIIEDLERSIGEKCAAALRPGKNVVSFEEMGQILRDTGPVAEESTEEPATAPESPNPSPVTGAPRRLSKRRDGAVVEGVCGGVADYFGIDVVIVRVLFTVLALVSGFGGVLYLILIFAMPEDPARIAAPMAAGKDSRTAITVLVILAVILTILIGVAAIAFFGIARHGVFFGEGRLHEIFLYVVFAIVLIVVGKVFRSIVPIVISVLLLLATLGRAVGFLAFPLFMMPIAGVVALALIAIAVWHLIRNNRSVSN